MTKKPPKGLPTPNLHEDRSRRALYQSVCDGALADGSRGPMAFCVYTVDIDEGRGDLYVAIGLGLALSERGYGVRLFPRDRWHEIDRADVVVAMLPTVDPSLAPQGAWTVAWVRNEVERWLATPGLTGFDQVIASSPLALTQLRRITTRATGVLPIGVDTDLFAPPPADTERRRTAVGTVHMWGTVRDVHREVMELPRTANVAIYGEMRGDPPKRLLRWSRPPLSYFALPDLYRRSEFVLDDMNATTLGYGALNSRFFESAACGALPIRNGLLGVRALDLPEVPIYRSGDLGQVLAELRAELPQARHRAEQLCEVVRSQHSWSVRADQFLEQLDRARSESPPSAIRRALHFFPDFSEANPYQTMLFAGLGDIGAHAAPVADLNTHLRRQTVGVGDPGVLSLHWTTPVLHWAQSVFSARHDLDEFIACLDGFQERGGRLIWTVHNLLAHDSRYPTLELELARVLLERADLVHVLSQESHDEVRQLVGIGITRVVLIPHCTYAGSYPDWITREAARRKLGIMPSEKVLLALGGVRPYKGLDRLLDVFDKLSAADPSLRLLIAGKPSPYRGTPELVDRCHASPRVMTRFEHLPNDQLQVWSHAADLAVLPYRRILNSGAFLLAESFGLPVVAPRQGALRSEGGHAHVRLFDPDQDGGSSAFGAVLRQALAEVVEDPDGATRAHMSALASAGQRSPQLMAEQFARSVEPLLGST